jgi:hypothetical protein
MMAVNTAGLDQSRRATLSIITVIFLLYLCRAVHDMLYGHLQTASKWEIMPELA